MKCVDFMFVDFDKILDKFVYLFKKNSEICFMPTLPSRYGNTLTTSGGSLPLILMDTRALKTTGGALPFYILHTHASGPIYWGDYLPCK